MPCPPAAKERTVIIKGDNIEKFTSPIPYWEFIKIKTAPCSFRALTERINSTLYDGKKLNSVFPFNYDAFPMSGDFSIVLLAQNYNQILHLKESLKEMGVKRDVVNYRARHLNGAYNETPLPHQTTVR